MRPGHDESESRFYCCASFLVIKISLEYCAAKFRVAACGERQRFIMQRASAIVHEEDFFVLSNLPPSRVQKRLALAVVSGILVIGILVTWPLAGVRLRPVAAFFPMYLMAMFLCDSITATLLFAQFAISRSLANLAIASGYVFTATTIVPYSLTFPGIFASTSVIGGLQSTAWLYDLWHVGFPMFVIGYTLLKDARPGQLIWPGKASTAIVIGVMATAAVVAAAAVVVFAFEDYSPVVILDNRRFGPLFPYYVGAPVVISCTGAIILLWFRRRSLLDLWLMVVLWLYVVEMPISYYPDPERFSLGWTAARIIGFLDSSILLIVLLYEITYLYSELLSVVRSHRREREARLVTGDAVAATIAHEVKQPLTGMMTSADAGLRFLKRAPPDIGEANEAFEQIVAAGRRASAVIGNIRTVFRKEVRNRAPLDLNGLIRETLAIVRKDLNKHDIGTEVELDDQLPRANGDRIQLQQVLVNLITNAIDSMAIAEGPRILSVKSTTFDDGNVGASISDTGKGIDPHDVDRIFSPLFSTKTEGMGMGLLICRSIIESHDGRLWVAPNTPQGAIFYFCVRCATV